MGVIAMPQMLNAGYDIRISAGVITAGGTLGILIPPSVMIIVYAAIAGVSVVKLYAGAMIPGLILAGLYVVYIIGWRGSTCRSRPSCRPTSSAPRCRRGSSALLPPAFAAHAAGAAEGDLVAGPRHRGRYA